MGFILSTPTYLTEAWRAKKERKKVFKRLRPRDVDLGGGHVVVILEDGQLLRVPEGYRPCHVPVGEITQTIADIFEILLD